MLITRTKMRGFKAVTIKNIPTRIATRHYFASQVLNEEDRVKKATLKSKREKLNRELSYARDELTRAQNRYRSIVDKKEIIKAQEKINKIKEELAK